MSVREPSDYSDEFAQRLQDLGLEAVLIGGLAALKYRREPRFTTDADFLAREMLDLPDQMEAEGYSVRTLAEPGTESPYLVMIQGKGVQVDVIKSETPFQDSAIDRAVDGVITVEDVIVFKLLADRQRDRDDVRSILAARHRLDEGYIEHWASEWQVLDRWHQAMATAD